MLLKQNPPICSKEVTVLSILLGCVGPWAQFFSVFMLYWNRFQNIYSLGYSPLWITVLSGLCDTSCISFQVVQMLLPNSPSSDALCSHFLWRKYLYWLSYTKNSFCSFVVLHSFIAASTSSLLQSCSSGTFYFFMFCLGGFGVFSPLMGNTFPRYICNATSLCFFQIAI